jgi:hypothetical protein
MRCGPESTVRNGELQIFADAFLLPLAGNEKQNAKCHRRLGRER